MRHLSKSWLITALFCIAVAGPVRCASGPNASELAQLRQLSDESSFKQAQQLSEKLIAQYPANAQLHMLNGSLLLKMGYLSASMKEYRTAHQLDPNSAEALVSLSELSLQNMELGPSLQYARQALKISPNNKGALAALILALITNDRLSEAQQYLLSALKQNPDDTELNMLDYQANMKQGNYARAKAALERAIQKKNNSPTQLADLGDLLESMGEHAQAQHCYRRSLALEPDSTETRCRLAKTLEYGSHDYTAAAREYRQVLRQDPESVVATAGLDRCYRKNNDLAGLLKLYLWHACNAGP